jgi:O-antigen/teichoic acid export membrane protein
MAYVWNQLGSFWLFAASFLLTLVIARGLSDQQYGVYAVALTFYNSAVYVAAFGLEDAATVFVPRTLALRGRLASAAIIRQLLAARLACVALVSIGIAWGLPTLVHWLISHHLHGAGVLGNVTLPRAIQFLALPVAAYVASTGVMNLLGAILTALLRTRLTLLVGGLAQVANVTGALIVTRLGTGVSGVLWILALVATVASVVYLVVLAPFLSHSESGAMGDTANANVGTSKAPSLRPVLRLGVVAWLTNLITGALLKQGAVSLLQFYAIGLVAIGYFNLAFQLSHAAAFLLVAGLGGVGLAVMAAAYAGSQRAGLSTAWRTVSKVQMLLAVPLLAFCTLRTSQIAVLLYGERYAAVGPLLTILILFTLGQRLAGGGSHQAALYVLGRQQLALWAQAGALVVTIGLGVLLIPQHGSVGGAAGALIAVGIGQVGAEVLQLVLAWRFLRRPYPVRCATRLCLALIPAMVFIALLPSHVSATAMRSLPARLPAPMELQALLTPSAALATFANLALSVVGFVAVLLVCLAIAKPLDGEDRALLASVSPRLARLLAVFCARDTSSTSVGANQGPNVVTPGDAL